MFFQLLINGLIAGAIYSLVASGFSLIYSTNKFVHFAHGAVLAFSAYILYWIFSSFHLGFIISALLSILFSAGLGYFVNLFFYAPLRAKKSSSSILLIASLAIAILLESLILMFFGADVKAFNLEFIKSLNSIEFLGAIITPLQLFIIFIAAMLFVALWIFMKKSKIGKAMRAVSDNRDVAEILGISAKKVYSWSFVIGSAIAGVGGVLIALEQNIEPTMGASLIIKGFTGAIIGGVGSVPGAILGSFLLGLVENFGIWFLPSGYKDAIAFVILFLFLLLRPRGILGIKIKD